MRALALFFISLLTATCFADSGASFYGSGHGSAAAGGAPTITYNSYEYGTNTGSGADVNVPAATSDGDLMVVVVNDDDGTVADPPAAGWTKILMADGYASSDLWVGYRVASSEPASYDFGSSLECSAIILLFKKSGGTWNIDDSDIDASGLSSLTVPAVTMGADGGVLVFGWGSDDTATVSTPPADMTERYIGSPASSQVGAWTQSVAAGDYSKGIVLSGGNSAAITVAIGLN